MSTPKIIGLAGLAGSGKDTVAGMLRDSHGAVPIAFADALRVEIARAFRIDASLLTERATKEHPMSALALRQCYDADFLVEMHDWHHHKFSTPFDEAAPRSPRQILQWWGTEYRRNQNPQYWVQAAANTLASLVNDQVEQHFVFTDVRFFNEATMVRGLGGQLWQVRRPGCKPLAQPHVSDCSGNHFDPEQIIRNDDTLQDLRNEVGYAASRCGWGVGKFLGAAA